MNGIVIPTCLWELQVCTENVFALWILIHSLAASKAIVDNKAKVTESQLQHFLALCWKKYVKARIEPGKWKLCELPSGKLSVF